MEKIKFEEAYEKLEKIVSRMEKETLALNESINLFEQGMELSSVCMKELEKSELIVKKLLKTEKGFTVESFETDEDKDE